MSVDTGILFSPISVKNLSLRNRVAMSPMTREYAVDGVLRPEVDEYYLRRARGGVGLIITEATTIGHEVAHYSAGAPHFHGAEAITRWSALVPQIHATGAAIFPQLLHAGSSRKRRGSPNPETPSIAPSPVSVGHLRSDVSNRTGDARIIPPPREMTLQDIEAVIAAYGDAAATAKEIGFDGVAIHGAHGYLPDLFFWERSNLRDDAYGGSIGNRMRFGIELLQEVRRRVGPDFPIMFRFSQWKGFDYNAKLAATPNELAQVLEPLTAAGVDIFDASTRRFWLPEFPGSELSLAGWTKKITGVTTMTVGSVGLESPHKEAGIEGPISVSTSNLSKLAAMMNRGDFDIVAIGRSLLANPDWVQLVSTGQFDRLRPYDASAVKQRLELGV